MVKYFDQNTLEEAARAKLLRQFYRTLQTTFRQCCPANGIDSPGDIPDDSGASPATGASAKENADTAARKRAELCTTVHSLLNVAESERTWEDAYQAEQYLTYLYAPAMLETELNRRMTEAANRLPETNFTFYKAYYAGDGNGGTLPATEDARRALLARLVNDLQWQASIKEIKRTFSQKMRKNTIWVFLLSLWAFLVLLHLPSLEPFTDFYYVFAAIGAGFWGAAFSMMINLRQRSKVSSLDDLKVLHRKLFIFSRVIIGVGAAVILFFFFHSELLTGQLFPRVSTDATSIAEVDSVLAQYLENRKSQHVRGAGIDTAGLGTFAASIERTFSLAADSGRGVSNVLLEDCKAFASDIAVHNTADLHSGLTQKIRELRKSSVPIDHKQLALLIVWCFLAGFSESLVPNLLAKTEKNMEGALGSDKKPT